jgi:hypothetical protein
LVAVKWTLQWASLHSWRCRALYRWIDMGTLDYLKIFWWHD